MHIVKANEVVVDYSASWGLWPTTLDVDYGRLHDGWNTRIFEHEDTRFEIRSRNYHAYSAYARANHLHLPPGKPVGNVNATIAPPRPVLEAQLQDLREIAQECQIIRWRHAFECYPYVSQHLKSLFKLSVVEFGDDCPGSSEVKVYPNSPGFHGLIYNMGVRAYETGEDTATAHKEHGIPYCALSLCGISAGLSLYLNRPDFSIECKAARQAQGDLPIELAYVGYIGTLNPPRERFLKELNVRAQLLDAQGRTTVLHGIGMRDGVLQPTYPLEESGIAIGGVYAKAMFTVNFPISSIYNSRLFDSGLTGMAQIVHDPHKEMAHLGLIDGVHYLAFDGSVDHLFTLLDKWSPASMGARRAEMVLAAHSQIKAALDKYSFNRVYGRLLHDLAPTTLSR